MENTIAYFGLKDEDDYMYKKGVAAQQAEVQRERKRFEQNQRFTVIGLLDTTNLTEAQIIVICNVSSELIKSVKKDMATAIPKIDRLKKAYTSEQIALKLNLPVNWVEKHLK
jgi:hypothetical protein